MPMVCLKDYCFCSKESCDGYDSCKERKLQEQTNEEWFCGLSTEEKALKITKFVMDIICWNNDPKPSEVFKTANKWLKEEYRET